MIQFANRLQFGPQLLIILQPLLHLPLLLGPNAELADSPARIADGENPNSVPLASTAL